MRPVSIGCDWLSGGSTLTAARNMLLVTPPCLSHRDDPLLADKQALWDAPPVPPEVDLDTEMDRCGGCVGLVRQPKQATI